MYLSSRQTLHVASIDSIVYHYCYVWSEQSAYGPASHFLLLAMTIGLVFCIPNRPDFQNPHENPPCRLSWTTLPPGSDRGQTRFTHLSDFTLLVIDSATLPSC